MTYLFAGIYGFLFGAVTGLTPWRWKWWLLMTPVAALLFMLKEGTCL